MRWSPSPDRSSLKRTLFSISLAVGVMLPFLTGCPGSLEGNFPGTGTGTGTGGMSGGGTGGSGVCDAPTMILKPTCGVPGCHQGGSPFQPDLSDDPIASHLVGVAAMNTSGVGSCAGMPLIDHNNPAASVILTRISGTACGPQMPYFLPALSASDMACLTSWVMAQ